MSKHGQPRGYGWVSLLPVAPQPSCRTGRQFRCPPGDHGCCRIPNCSTRLSNPAQNRRPKSNRGFTLIETALAIVIIGTGVLAIMTAQAAFHQQNDWSTHTSTATFLANEIREMTDQLPLYDPVTGNAQWGPEDNETMLADFDDLDDFDGVFGEGVVFSNSDGTGPVNAMRQVISGMIGWSQIVKVYNVDPTDISAQGDPAMDGTTDMMRIEVTITYQGVNDPGPVTVTTVSWVTGNPQ